MTIPDDLVEAEVARARERYAKDQKTVRYFDSERGRNFIRSTLRRSRIVERLVDDWLAAHPEHPALPHLEDQESALETSSAEAAAAIGATDQGTVLADEDAQPGSTEPAPPAETAPGETETAETETAETTASGRTA